MTPAAGVWYTVIMEHVYTNPYLIVIMVIMLALLVVNEVHKRRPRKEPPPKPVRDRRSDPVWKDRGSL